jgi:superfamily II DNA helicase RecQ
MIAVKKRKKSDDWEEKTPKRPVLADITPVTSVTSKRHMVYNPYARILVPTVSASTPRHFVTTTPNVASSTSNILPSVTPAPASAPNRTRSFVVDEATDDESDDTNQIPSRQLDYKEKATAATTVPVTTRVSIFKVTRVGATCMICCVKVGSGDSAIARHIRHNHPSIVGTVTYAAISREIKAAIETEKHVPIDGDSATTLKCFICGRCYLSIHAFNRHQRDQVRCQSSHPVKVEAVKLSCGRVVDNDTAKGTVYSTVVSDFGPTETVLKAYIRPDEIASLVTYVPLFHPFVRKFSVGDFDSQLKERIGWWSQPPTTAELPLMDVAEQWLMTRARYEVGLVPGHYKAALLQFDCQEIGEVSQNLTYNFRHKEAILLGELKQLLLFLWRHCSPLIQGFRQADLNHPYFIPKLLVYMVLEPVATLHECPLLVEYCLVRCFNRQCKMVQAGDAASNAGTIMSMARAAICSLLCSFRMVDDVAGPLIRDAQRSRSVNIISPMIRKCREIQRRKPKNRMVTVDVEGNVAVDGFEFPKRTWSRLVGIVLDRSKTFLRLLLAGNQWERVLDVGVPLRVTTLVDGDMEFSLADSSYSSQDVVLATDFEIMYLDKLVSYLRLAMHGIGLGSMRLQELTALSMRHGVWHRGTLYYSSSSIKTFTHKSTGGNAVDHKLPVRLGRLFVLFRSIVRKLVIAGIDITLIVPQRTSATHSICDAVSEIFGLDQRPDATQVRHMWTSICNIVFPSGEISATLSAVDDVAEMSGHSSATHSRTYGSLVHDGREYLYRKFHEALGDAVSTDVVGPVAITEYDLMASLEYSFGQCATYTCKAQETLVNSMLLRSHCHANLPCGAGKSAAWLLPLVANATRNSVHQGFSIVVLPYNFLASYHRQSAETFLRSHNVWVASFHTNDFGPAKFPQELQDNDILPDIVFLSLDGLNLFIKHQFARLLRLCQYGKVTRIFIDEIHTVFTEGFRSSYESLPRLASLGIPVVTMSATVPKPYLSPLLRYLKLSATVDGLVDDVITVDHGGSLLGHFPTDFHFRVAMSTSPNDRAFDTIKRLLRRPLTRSIHVIVSSRAAAEEISTKLETGITSRVITSESSRAVIDETAILWKDGFLRVLISTTIGLVGNECRNCRHVVIVGHLYNVMSVVQAIGRLLAHQRLDGASIDMILPKLSAKRISDFAAESRIEFNKLVARKLVPHDWEVFQTFSTTNGIVNWINTPGCQLANLDALFGHTRRKCDVCSVCKNEPLTEMAVIASRANTQSTEEQHRAVDILRRLVERCLVCNSSLCDGDTCIPKNRCYRCGEAHQSRNCPVSSKIKHIMNGVGCSYCFDVKERFGFETHDYGTACSMKRRLRRLMIQESTGSFDSFVSNVTSEVKLFYQFLSKAKLKFLPVEKR